MPERAHIGLGSNLGDRRSYLAAGLAAVAALPGTHLAAVNSSWRAAVAGRLAVWPVLEHAPERSFGRSGWARAVR